jgi:hypothetical protein
VLGASQRLPGFRACLQPWNSKHRQFPLPPAGQLAQWVRYANSAHRYPAQDWDSCLEFRGFRNGHSMRGSSSYSPPVCCDGRSCNAVLRRRDDLNRAMRRRRFVTERKCLGSRRCSYCIAVLAAPQEGHSAGWTPKPLSLDPWPGSTSWNHCNHHTNRGTGRTHPPHRALAEPGTLRTLANGRQAQDPTTMAPIRKCGVRARQRAPLEIPQSGPTECRLRSARKWTPLP